MGRLKNSVVGRHVFDKKQNLEGVVTREDGTTLTICYTGLDGKIFYKRVTSLYFRTNFRLLENKNLAIDLVMKQATPQVKTNRLPTCGAECTGGNLLSIFKEMIKNISNQDVTISRARQQIHYKFNGKPMFLIYPRQKRLVVCTYTKALTPRVIQKAWKVNEGNDTLNGTVFIFTKLEERPIMRALILDCIYYRQIIDKGEFENVQDKF